MTSCADRLRFDDPLAEALAFWRFDDPLAEALRFDASRGETLGHFAIGRLRQIRSVGMERAEIPSFKTRRETPK